MQHFRRTPHHGAQCTEMHFPGIDYLTLKSFVGKLQSMAVTMRSLAANLVLFPPDH